MGGCLLGVLAAGALGLVVIDRFGASILNMLSSNGSYALAPAIAYGEHERQVLDVYRPARTAEPAPVLLFFYGGGWTDGDRRDYEFVASSFTREGYVVVLPDYRVHPEVTFPAFAEDAAAAAAWTQEHVADHGGDPERIFVAGHSAGAHLGALLVLWPDLMEGAGGDPAGFAGFVGLAGPYDFLPLDEASELERIFPEPGRAESQPVHHVDANEALPPVLLVHGSDDERVWPRNSRRLAAALERRGANVTLVTYDGIGHARLAASLAAPLDFLASTRADVLDWLGAR